MSESDRVELSALVVWLKTFPQTQQFCAEKENLELVDGALLDNPSFGSCIYDIAVEVCNPDDGVDSTQAQSGDLWDNILAMTRKIDRRNSLEPPQADTPHCWEDFRKHAALAYLLDGAVAHKDIDLRRVYIERIMELSGADQRTLMSLIERRKKKPRTPSKKNRSARKRAKLTNENNAAAANTGNMQPREPLSPRNTNFTPDKASPMTRLESNFDGTPTGLAPRRSFDDAFGSTEQYFRALSPAPRATPATKRGIFSPGLGDSGEYEKRIQELKENNERLEHDLEESRQKEDNMTKRLEDMESNYRKEMMKVEASSRRREDESREQYETRLAALRSELEIVTNMYEQAQGAKEELAGVKDEMDLMVHTKAMLAETTERLRTYKEKVQQLTDVKEALQKEEEAHSRSVDECLRLENELKTLQPLKRQLDEYKTRAVDAEVKFAECQDELMKTKQEKLSSSDSNEKLEAQIQSQAQEIEELTRRIQYEEKAKADGAGLGDGMSELNPQLKEELLRLRNENKQLKEFASKREDDAVTRLEENLEDASRLTERFKSQFLSTKGQLETTQGDLKESQEREAILQNHLSDTKTLLSETMSEAELLSTELQQCSNSLEASKKRESKLEEELSFWVDQSKSLQSQTEGLTERLQQCSSDLNDSIAREARLKNEVVGWTKKHEESEAREADLSEKLDVSSKLVDTLQQEGLDLRGDVAEWKQQAQTNQESAVALMDQLQTARTELTSLREKEETLNVELQEASDQVNVANEKILNLEKQLDNCVEDLDETRQALLKSKETEDALRNDLGDMTIRADDSEAMSKQRMELVQSTRQKLKTARTENTKLSEEREKLASNVKSLNEKHAALKVHADKVQRELADARDSLEQTEETLKESQRKTASVSRKVDKLNNDVEEWKNKAVEEEKLTEKLQEELLQTRELLNKTQGSLKILNDNEVVLKEELDHAEHLIFELEDSVEEQTEAKKNLEKDLEATQHEKAKIIKIMDMQKAELMSRLNEQIQQNETHKQQLFSAKETLNETQGSLGASQEREKRMENEITKLQEMQSDLRKQLESANDKTQGVEAQKEKLAAKFDEETQQSNKYKQELFSAQETLNETQSSLGASQHREKMMKHEIAKLKDIESDLRQELERAIDQTQQAAKEAAQSMDNSREALSARAQKEYEELQNNMNQLLEDERRAKRRDEERHKEQLQELRESFDEEISELKKRYDDDARSATERSNSQVETLKDEMKEKMEAFRKTASKEKQDLILKGKGMLSDTRKKAKEELNAVTADLECLQEQFDNEKREKEKIAKQYTEKVAEYKKKLQLTTNRINSLSADGGELEEKVTLLEREKLKLLEENDRYRRQLGGRFGSDSKVQSQLEKVQKEFKSAMEEIRELRQKQQSQSSGLASALPPIDENGEAVDHNYSRGAVNQSTLVQLRTEYEETIEALNDEKRELVMKNSAAFTDVQKAEKRAWECEQQNADLQQDVTSLKLQVARLEHMLSSTQDASESQYPVVEKHPAAGQHLREQPVPEDDMNDSIVSSMGNDDSSDLRDMAAKKNTDMMMDGTEPPKSFIDLHAKSPGPDAAPECKQS